MKEYFKNALVITNHNLPLALWLLVLMFVISLYLSFISYAVNTPVELIIAAVTLIFMFGAAASGWLFMVKKAVLSEKFELKALPAGVGQYFLPVTGMFLMFAVLSAVCMFVVYKLNVLVFGALDFDPALLKQAVISHEGMKIFLNSLSQEQLMQLNGWNMALIAAGWVLSFFTMFWLPEIMFGVRNPALALWLSIKNNLKKPLNAVKLLVYIILLNSLLSLLSTLSMYNPVTYSIMIIPVFYFIVYVIVLVFSYYEAEYQRELPPAH